MRHPKSNWKLTEETARQVRELAQAEVTLQSDIAATFGISVSHVSNIKAERRWGSISSPHCAPAPGGRKGVVEW